MSEVLDCKLRDVIYCMVNFFFYPDIPKSSRDHSTDVKVGEAVLFLEAFFDETEEDDPEWMIKFQTNGGCVGTASASYFLIKEY
ncbi:MULTISPECIES: hypothetical protein [unclassified Clostridium]|uniref:hypothetical protein n=1 Tax=unclassified Clostridium TaxID=2614128 RepID=UPI0002974AA7|nr:MULTISPECIES: hypothetical protein [unclassified Clostridium]EKQ54381.1 MAG: hypothetical protein A370_03204 [Clostridium sp. Maddingley MBC34-26]